MARKLKNVTIEEITLCGEPAIKKKFYIKKFGGLKMDKLLEVLKKILGDEEINDTSIEKIKALPEENVENLRKALDEIEGFQENFPPALDEAFLSLAKSATYDYPVKESEAELDFEDVKKAGASLSKATVAQLKKIQEIIEKLIGEKTKKFKKEGSEEEIEIPEDIQKRLDKLDKIEKEAKEKAEKEAKEKAEKEEKEKAELLKRIEKLEKKRGTKKSIDGQDDDAGDEGDEEDKFPSIPVVS